MGRARPIRADNAKSPFLTSGLESAQRKRYLRCLEEEQGVVETETHAR